MRIVLASSSPRRRKLLCQLGIDFMVHAPHEEYAEEYVPETLPSTMGKKGIQGSVISIAIANASLKTSIVAREASSSDVIIGADTIVLLGSEILGKPKDHSQAHRMLARLSGKMHLVITGISVLDMRSGRVFHGSEVTEVYFRRLLRNEIDAYIKSGEPMDKAGAYGIQGLGALLVKRINGCYFNVVGLPLLTLSKLLNKCGVRIL